MDDLQTRLDDLNDTCNEGMQAKVHLESRDRELSNQLHLVSKELELCQGNEQTLRVDNKALEQQRWNNEKQISEL